MERRSPALYAHKGNTCPRPASHEPGNWLRVKARYANMLVSGVSEGGNRLVDDAKRVRAAAAELAARPTRHPAAKRGAGREEPWADAGVSGTSRRRTERADAGRHFPGRPWPGGLVRATGRSKAEPRPCARDPPPHRGSTSKARPRLGSPNTGARALTGTRAQAPEKNTWLEDPGPRSRYPSAPAPVRDAASLPRAPPLRADSARAH